jgi:hypothetical protein
MSVVVAVREDKPVIEIGYSARAAIASVHCFTYFAGGIHW